MRIPLALINFFLIAALLAACAPQPVQAQIAQSDKPRNQNPTTNSSSQQQLVAGNTAFAFDLYNVLRSDPKTTNLFFSPYSISTALAMTQAGARGETLKQLNQVLHFTLADKELHSAFNALQLALASREKNSREPEKKDFRLNIANATWAAAQEKFNKEFLDLLAESYGSGLRLMDFKADPEKARQTINEWVAKQTEDKIKELLDKGIITAATAMVLTNAIYFNASWQTPFGENNTTDKPFNNLDGKQPNVPTMSVQGDFGYFQGAGYQAIELPYTGNKLSMLVLVPDANKFSEIEKGLNAGIMETIHKGLQGQTIKLELPKFKIESSFGLADVLSGMGMKDIFIGGKADLSGMNGARDLFVSAIVHKSYVNVDEKGTEAAAATAVVISKTSMPVNILSFKVDRPFIFLIQDNESGSILFLGRMANF